MSLAREFRSQVFSHVNRTGNRIVGNSAREYEADRVASISFGARATQTSPVLAFNRAEHFSNREIPLVRALDLVSFCSMNNVCSLLLLKNSIFTSHVH